MTIPVRTACVRFTECRVVFSLRVETVDVSIGAGDT